MNYLVVLKFYISYLGIMIAMTTISLHPFPLIAQTCSSMVSIYISLALFFAFLVINDYFVLESAQCDGASDSIDGA